MVKASPSRQGSWQDTRGRARPAFPMTNWEQSYQSNVRGQRAVDRVPGRGQSQTCFFHNKPAVMAATGMSEQMREGGGGRLCYTTDHYFSGHVEILRSAYCEVDQDIPVSRDKVAKIDPWMRE